MTARRLLYLSAHQMTAYHWRSGMLTAEAQFTVTPTGHQQFAAYLAQRKGSVFSLLANVPDEGFQIETIPYLHGADRKTVIARKLGQLFFNASLTTALSLGHEKSRRKNERLLLAALTNSASFAPWLNALTAAEAALAAVVSLPLLTASLLKRLQIVEPHCLVLSVQDQSIRQSYFENGELHFSRLTTLQDSSQGGMAQALAAEAIKLQQYLSSQRMIARNQAITAHLLAHSSAAQAIRANCADTPTVRFRHLAIDECAKRTGLKGSLPDSHSEPLFLNLLAVAPPRAQFADDDLRHHFHLGQIRAALTGVGAAAMLGCLLFSAKLLYETYSIGQQTNALRDETSLATQRYNSIASTFPPIPTSNESLRRVVDRYVTLEATSPLPINLYREISRALQASPPIEVDRIDWRVGGKSRSSSPASAQPGDVPNDNESALIQGKLRFGQRANARQVLATFDGFLDALRANPELRVEVPQRPFDVESGKSLKGGDANAQSDAPRTFAVRVLHRVGT